MQLPPELRQAIEDAAVGTATEAIHEAAESISRRYRIAAPNARSISSAAERIAYLATRLPATFAAACRVAAEAIARISGLEVKSLLDLGSGPGTATWAAAAAFPGLEQA